MVSAAQLECSGTFSRSAAVTEASEGEGPAGTAKPGVTEGRKGQAEVPARTSSKVLIIYSRKVWMRQTEDACCDDSRGPDQGPFLPSLPRCRPQFNNTPLFTQKATSETLTFLRRHSGPSWVPAHLSLVVQIRPHLREKGSTISHSLEAAGVNQGGLQPKHIGTCWYTEVSQSPLIEFF